MSWAHSIAFALVAPPRAASAVEQAGAVAGNREPVDLVEHQPIVLPAPCARRRRRNRAHDLRQSKQGPHEDEATQTTAQI